MGIKAFGTGLGNYVIRRCAGPFWCRRKWLSKTQWLSKDELELLQLGLLQKLIKHCYETVPYYRNLMDGSGIRVGDIQSLSDVQRFSVLTKDDILNAGNSLVSSKYPRFMQRVAYTGGTTGTPVKLHRDLFSIGNEHAFVRRQWDWAGIGLKDKTAYLTGRLVADTDEDTGKLYAYYPFMKELALSTYHLSPLTAVKYIDVIKEYKIKALAGYPSAIYLLANACFDHGIKLKLDSVLTSSETLTESMRKTISRAFGCKVYDYYGSAERVCYIFTCKKGGYHIQPEYGYTELIAADGSCSSKCRVVSTGFWNKAMPLIRYDLGDIVDPSTSLCECGRQFPLVKSIVGRKADCIKTVSGREFGAAILTHLLYGTDHIVESQIVQNSLDHIIIKYVPANDFSAKDLKSFDELIKKHLPSELKHEFMEVEKIARTSSGKLKPVISNI